MKISDKAAVSACLNYADDQKTLVEPSCGAAQAVCYEDILTRLSESGRIGRLETLVVVVCGGFGVTLGELEKWRVQFGL